MFDVKTKKNYFFTFHFVTFFVVQFKLCMIKKKYSSNKVQIFRNFPKKIYWNFRDEEREKNENIEFELEEAKASRKSIEAQMSDFVR